MSRRRPIASLITQAQSLLGKVPGVDGVGFGLRQTEGTIIDELAWRVYTKGERPEDGLPASLLGYPVDVIRRLPTMPARGRKPARIPSKAGMPIANSKGVPGTLGCFVTFGDEERGLLSNHHILFGREAGEAEPIWLIEYLAEGGHLCQEIGANARGFIGSYSYRDQSYYLDGAVGKLNEAARIVNEEKATVNGLATLEKTLPGTRVKKMGSGTGYSEGMVVDVNYPDRAFVDGEAYDAPNQLLVSPLGEGAFSKDGDSGSVLLDEQNLVVGLLWGSNARGEGVACPIEPLVEALGVEMRPFARPWYRRWLRAMATWKRRITIT